MLPRTCIPCEKIEEDCYDWYTRHALKLEEVKTKCADIMFIGDSITHFWTREEGEHTYGGEVWDEFYGKRNTLNLGFGFDRTQNMLWRIANGEVENQNPKFIVVNAGTNQFSHTLRYGSDSGEIAFEGAKLLVDTLHERFPNAIIIVMAVFPRLGQIKDETIQSRIDVLNKLMKAHTEGKPWFKFLDISAELRNPDGSFNPENYADGACHLNNNGYRIWANALEPIFTAAGL